MKALARSFVSWPSIIHDLEEMTRACIKCLETNKKTCKNSFDFVGVADDAVAPGARRFFRSNRGQPYTPNDR